MTMYTQSRRPLSGYRPCQSGERAKQQYGFSMHNFCILGKQIHLGLSAGAWNKAHCVKGHARERCFSKVIDRF